MVKDLLFIFDLDGVIWNLIKDKQTDEFTGYALRPEVISELDTLSTIGSVVLATRANRETMNIALAEIDSRNYKFHGVYSREDLTSDIRLEDTVDKELLEKIREERPGMTFDDLFRFKKLNSIYEDFEIPPEEVASRVVYIEDLQLSHEEIGELQGRDLLIRKSVRGAQGAGFSTRYCFKALPYQGNVPVSILVPDLEIELAGEGGLAVPMSAVGFAIRRLITQGRANIQAGYDKLPGREYIKVKHHHRPEAPGEPQGDLAELTGDVEHKYLIIPGGLKNTEYEKPEIIPLS